MSGWAHSDEDVIHMREMWRRGASQSQIAEAFNTSRNYARAMVFGDARKDLPLAVTREERSGRPRFRHGIADQ